MTLRDACTPRRDGAGRELTAGGVAVKLDPVSPDASGDTVVDRSQPYDIKDGSA